MSAIKSLGALLTTLDELLRNKEFIDQLAGDDQGFLDTCWDFFVRIEDDLTSEEIAGEDPVLWRTQQDAETD